MFNFTRALREIDESLVEAHAQLAIQERMLNIVEKYMIDDEIQAKKIKLEELIHDLDEAKNKMINLSNKDKFIQFWNLSSLNHREFTLRVLIHEYGILKDPIFDEILKDAPNLDARTAMFITDSFMDKYPADTGIRWILPYL